MHNPQYPMVKPENGNPRSVKMEGSEPLPRFAATTESEQLDAEAPVLGSIQSLQTRLARSTGEIRAAQALRFEVFYREMSAIADAKTLANKRDEDTYDRYCDHLLVIDRDLPASSQIVGTYRFLQQDIARKLGGFYSEQEFALAPLLENKSHLKFIELGRSCVSLPYRNKRTVELLWQGTWAHVLENSIDVMVGCASLEGTNPDELALPLSFMHHHARADEDWKVKAVAGKGVAMNRMPKNSIDMRKALHSLPPMIKGYLRLGAWIGEEAVIDWQFGTTDVLIILPVANINPRYINHFGADASRYS